MCSAWLLFLFCCSCFSFLLIEFTFLTVLKEKINSEVLFFFSSKKYHLTFVEVTGRSNFISFLQTVAP